MKKGKKKESKEGKGKGRKKAMRFCYMVKFLLDMSEIPYSVKTIK